MERSVQGHNPHRILQRSHANTSEPLHFGKQQVSYTAEIFGSSIVLVGQFNPAIFTADWLERNSLIGSEDAEYARASTNVLVSHAVAVCETEWFALQVLENQFSLTSKGALSHAFRDLAEGIATLVPHTPVTALGLNFMGHYKMSTEAGYHMVGDVLVPKNCGANSSIPKRKSRAWRTSR